MEVQYHIVRNRFYVLLAVSLLLGESPSLAESAGQNRLMRVNVPVADLRAEPTPASGRLDHDPLEESQLLYGDPVEILEESQGWVRVNAVDQAEWTHGQRWEGYPGWIERAALTPDPGNWIPNFVVTAKQAKVREKPEPDAPVRLTLSLGTRLLAVKKSDVRHRPWRKLRFLDGTEGWIQANEVRHHPDFLKVTSGSVPELRQRLVETARLFLGDPYYWGGRSAHDPVAAAPPQKAVDCSGLVGLVYQANGLKIPRDAHEQWMKAKAIPQGKLLPGDLVFLADPKNPERMTHVMLYIGNDRVIEGPGTGEKVREIGLQERLKEAENRRVACGTYLGLSPETRP